MIEHAQWLESVLGLFDEYEAHDSLYWRRNVPDLRFFVIVNDVFWWGTADLQEITPENFDLLKQTFKDCEAVDDVVGECYADIVFAARVRKLRPQGASYPKDKRFWPLLDACGPERKIGLGNPYKPGEYKSELKKI